jgi:hypothetical protein
LFDTSDFERIAHTFDHAHERKAAAVFFAADIGANQRANTSGIQIGNLA